MSLIDNELSVDGELLSELSTDVDVTKLNEPQTH